MPFEQMGINVSINYRCYGHESQLKNYMKMLSVLSFLPLWFKGYAIVNSVLSGINFKILEIAFTAFWSHWMVQNTG